MAGFTWPGLWIASLLLAGGDGPDPAALADRLGAARYSDREAAGEALIRIGPGALPALAKGRESRDIEVRRRAEILAARIEADAVLGATRVRLGLRDRPLAEAVGAIASGSGMRLDPAGPGATWPDARVTLVAGEPLPFWGAVDRLCEAGGLRRQYPPEGTSFFPVRPPFGLDLVPGRARPPASDSGALRVELIRVRHRLERDHGDGESAEFPFGSPTAGRRDPKTGATLDATYAADLLVSAEPRLRIFGGGEVEKAEAIDDRGRSLVKLPTPEEERQEREIREANPHLDPALHPGLRYGGGSRSSMKTWPARVALAYPSPPARRIARLGGVIPVVVVARRPDPLTIELKGSTGKEFAAGPARITVHEFRAEPGREATVDLTLAPDPADLGETLTVSDTAGARVAVNRPIDLMELRLEVLDGAGEVLSWQYTRPPSDPPRVRMAIVIHNRRPERNPPEGLRLRYWGIAAAATDLRFSFAEVPTP